GVSKIARQLSTRNTDSAAGWDCIIGENQRERDTTESRGNLKRCFPSLPLIIPVSYTQTASQRRESGISTITK
ncbi:hypothetical protein ACOQJ6_34200, partial [Klebsiella pneumoniae]|uniref:hypothetical protein n=1 Tax=Klebsiella pneumoniae TaxID=573 RepID=UPI003015A20F